VLRLLAATTIDRLCRAWNDRQWHDDVYERRRVRLQLLLWMRRWIFSYGRFFVDLPGEWILVIVSPEL
jgi:hypothetical protein